MFSLVIAPKGLSKCGIQQIARLRMAFTVDSRYLAIGYLEQPLISMRNSGPCLILTSGNKILWIREEIAP